MSRWRPLEMAYLPETRWAFGDVVLALGAGFAAAILAGSVMVAVTAADEITVAQVTVTLLAQSAATVATLIGLGRSRGTGSLAERVGLAWRRSDTWGILAGLALQVVVAVLIGGLIRLLAPDELPQQAVAGVVGGASRWLEIVVLLVMLVGVAPVVEEIVYRAVLLSRLRRSMAPWPAILVSAAFFAGVHLIDPGALYAVPGLFVIGVALGWLALATGDIGLPIAVHAGVNLTGALALIFEDELAEAVDAVVHLVF